MSTETVIKTDKDLKYDKDIARIKELSDPKKKLNMKEKQELTKLNKKYINVTRKEIKSEKWNNSTWSYIVKFLVKMCNANKSVSVKKGKTIYDFGHTKIIDFEKTLRIANATLKIDVIIPEKDYTKSDFLRGNPRKLKKLIELRFKKELEIELAEEDAEKLKKDKKIKSEKK